MIPVKIGFVIAGTTIAAGAAAYSFYRSRKKIIIVEKMDVDLVEDGFAPPYLEEEVDEDGETIS